MRPMKTLGGNTQKKCHQTYEQKGVGETAMGQQLFGWAHPETRHEIYVGQTLSQCPPQHGFLPKRLIGKQFADTGAKSYMRERIHRTSNVKFSELCVPDQRYRFMSILRQLAEYLYIKKKDPNRNDTSWVKYMHGINRLSILLFLFALVVIFVRACKN